MRREKSIKGLAAVIAANFAMPATAWNMEEDAGRWISYGDIQKRISIFPVCELFNGRFIDPCNIQTKADETRLKSNQKYLFAVRPIWAFS